MTDGGEDGERNGNSDSGATDGTNAADDAGGNGGADAADDADRDRPRRESPFSDLADRVRERRATGEADGTTGEADGTTGEAADGEAVEDLFAELGAGEPGVEGKDPFETMDVGDLHAEDVWEALEAEAEPAAQPSVGVGEAEPVERDDPTADRPDHVVPKASYCQRCEYFTDPPEVACTHEGTDIVAVVDAEHFRVRGCPVVAAEALDGPNEG